VIQEAIRSVLLAEVTVSTLVGQRIYGPGSNGLLPQKPTMPAISLSRPPGPSQPITLDGYKSIRPVRLQLDSWAETGDEAWTLARAVDARLNGFSGVVGSQKVNLVTQAIAPGEFPEPDLDLHRVTADYFVHGVEAA
jgi:hypothetical protein